MEWFPDVWNGWLTGSVGLPRPSILSVVPQFVSVPEKTLEHWASQYIAYRYRSWAAQWWPVSGEDIDLRWLPARAGKAVQLELKTTTVVRPGVHEVKVDLGQLWDYRLRPLGRQPFYVFPRPGPSWDGELAAAAVAHGRAVTEFGFARSGPGWWFADWMVVLTAAQVAGVLHRELAAHGSKKRGKTERLVRFDLRGSKTVWGAGTAAPSPVNWRDFWAALEDCGRAGWPQLIRLPARIVRAEGPYQPSQIIALLREVSPDMPATDQKYADEPLVTLEPDLEGTYQVTADIVGSLSRTNQDAVDDEDGNDQDNDHRLIVFLDAQRLGQTR